MKVYHGTTSVAKKKILSEGEIHPSQSRIETSIDTILEWALLKSTLTEMPTMGSVRQPTALGDGIYAFEKIMDAEKFRPDHEVIIITLKDTETILNLDDWQVLYELADTLMSTSYEDVFEKRFYSEETRKQYRKLFKLFAEFIIDVANGEKQIDDYAYVFAFALWFLDVIFGKKYRIVSRTFPEQPKYICIRDQQAIESFC